MAKGKALKLDVIVTKIFIHLWTSLEMTTLTQVQIPSNKKVFIFGCHARFDSVIIQS
jgi:hypothetical protein